MVIWGADDPVLRHERLVPQFMADLRTDNVHVLEGASHFVQEDRPDEIAELITEFVRLQVD